MSKVPWMLVAEQEIGVKEVPGDGDNPRIVEYHSVTTLKATDDEVPWCSSFACWCMEQVGIRITAEYGSGRVLAGVGPADPIRRIRLRGGDD